MVVAIVVGNLDIGAWSVQTTSREEEKVKAHFPKAMERVKVKVGRARTTSVKVSSGKDMREKVRGKVGGTRVHVSTVAKLHIKLHNA